MSNEELVHTGPAVPLKVLPSAERGGAVGALIAAKAAVSWRLAQHMVVGHGDRFEADVVDAAVGADAPTECGRWLEDAIRKAAAGTRARRPLAGVVSYY